MAETKDGVVKTVDEKEKPGNQVRCVGCGKSLRIEPNEINAHVAQCEEHPLHKSIERIRQLEGDIQRLREERYGYDVKIKDLEGKVEAWKADCAYWKNKALLLMNEGNLPMAS